MFYVMSYTNKYISSLLSLVLCLFVSLPSIILEGQEQRNADIKSQSERIAQLSTAYANDRYTKVNENSFTSFDLDKAYSDGVKYNDVSFVATHNSYQTACTSAYKKLYGNLSTVTFGLVDDEITEFNSDTLTEQFNLGIRSIELDVETIVDNGKVSFVCSHSPVIDMTSNCYNFELALKEIKMWSDANPNHIPVTIIIEPKKVFIPDIGMRYFNLQYVNALDNMLRDVLGDTLITPSDMMGEHSSLKEMRETDDWMTLSETNGHVIVLLHDTTVTEKYIAQDESIKSQAMFPMLRYKDRDKSYASFLLVNKPDDAVKYGSELLEKNLIFRTQVDEYGSHTDEKRANAFASGAQILSTDYPVKNDMTSIDYFVSFEDGYTMSLTK